LWCAYAELEAVLGAPAAALKVSYS
jgi:hypothetical protein